jgi:hypothetical protein
MHVVAADHPDGAARDAHGTDVLDAVPDHRGKRAGLVGERDLQELRAVALAAHVDLADEEDLVEGLAVR